MKNLFFILLFFPITIFAQVGVNTTVPNAMLDIQSTNNGVLIPRVQLTSKLDNSTVLNPAGGALQTSTLVYNMAAAGVAPNDVVAGFYYWDNNVSKWIPIAGNSSGDHDWYKVGTTTAPTAITEDMFHTGKAAIGTSTPQPNAFFQVDLGTNKTDGVLFTGTLDPASSVPSLGAGSRMMFFPGKSAFRVGSVVGTEWNDSNVGGNSVAMGRNTIASGYSSTALGSFSTAVGSFSTALGTSAANGTFSTSTGVAIANGNYSLATGFSTANGQYSISGGSGTIATGDNSFAMGNNSQAIGTSSVAMGRNTNASGFISSAFGNFSSATGTYSIAMGSSTANGLLSTSTSNSTANGDYSFATGFSTANGQYSMSGGSGTIATGDNSFAMGNNSQAIGTSSVAMGRNTNASGFISSAFGNFSSATGTYSTAMGSSTANGLLSTSTSNSTANGDYSFATGFSTANGQYSMSGGYNSIASGTNSFAMGNNTQAIGSNSVAMGNISTASGFNATALGASQAVGIYSTALSASIANGFEATATANSTANGDYSIAGGMLSNAGGNSSIAIGSGVIAQSIGEVSFGLSNRPYAMSASGATTFNANDHLFNLGNGNGSPHNALTVFKNGRLTINEAYTLPNIDGTANQVLQTDGAGNVSWQTPTSTASWLINGNSAITTPANPATYGTSTIGAGENFLGTTTNNDVVFATNTIERMRVKNTTGNIGIGTANPTEKLHVFQSSNATKSGIFSEVQQIATGTDYDNIAIKGHGRGIPFWGLGNGVMGIGDVANSYYATGVYAHLGTTAPALPFSNQALYSNGNGLGYAGIFMGGNVGIGVTNPSNLLHVNSATNGAVRIVDGTQGANKVLTSDVNGVGTWKPVGIDNIQANLSGVTGISISYTDTVNFLQTGASITLPPGRYAVNVTMLLSTVPGAYTNSNEAFWVRSTFSDSNGLNPAPSGHIVGSFLISGNLVPSTLYSLISGMIVINNPGPGPNTYYYVAGRVVTNNSTRTIAFFGGSYWAENNIIAYRLN